MKKLSDQVTIGGQPTQADLQRLAGEGFRSVINLRTEGEEDPVLSPAEEGEAARKAGLQYAHVPVTMKTLTPEKLDQFRQAMGELPAPVYVHCKGGTRAGLVAATQAAADAGKSGEDALCEIDALNLEIDSPAVREFVRGYVDRQRGG